MTSTRNDTRPVLAVGLMSAPEVDINFISGFAETGSRHFSISEISEPLLVAPVSDDSVFEVAGVTIGVGFHWEQRQSQRFRGAVELVPDNGMLVIINHVDVEDYLRSVISSEMNAASPVEFLKAHAVISRSWVLRQIGRRPAGTKPSESVDGDEIIRWYDREDHTLFDVCADDHCQRYQGVTRLTTDAADEAVKATEGLVLMHDGEICDARFSKCCGGATEEFPTCWDNERHPYLKSFRDTLPASPLARPNYRRGRRAMDTLASGSILQHVGCRPARNGA